MTQPEKQSNGVVVQILGEEYQISSQSDPAEVRRIADYVDEKMRGLAAQHAGRVPRGTLAVLAAMEITSDLFGAMREQSQLTETAQENLERLSRLVDERADMFSSLLEGTTQTFNRRPQPRPVGSHQAAPAE
jgi:cell division protein ZapA